MTDTQKIVFLYRASNVPDEILAAFHDKTPAGFTLVPCDEKTPAQERKALVASADYLVNYGTGFEDFEQLERARLFQVLAAGYDRLDIGAFGKAGVPVATNGGANAPTVAEHAVMLMLAVYKKLPLHHNAMQQNRWLGHQEVLKMRELRGKQVGIVGFGQIGREVARIVNGFLATPVYYDVQAAPAEVEREFRAKRLELADLFATSDVVTVHTPLTPGTRGLVGTEMLGRMKPTAIFINTARGPVMDETALLAALDEGRIAGAGLDVFHNEPLEPDSRFLGRENVVVSPHNAGATLDTWTRRLDFAIANIGRVSRGEKPLSVVKA